MEQTIRDRYSDDILSEAMRRYDIAPDAIAEAGGFESFIYRYTRGGERFILRLTHTLRRTPEQIHGEVDWINYLAAGGATVARAVLSARQELVEAIDDGQGGRFLATAFSHAPGRPPWETGWTPARYEAYGRLIGRMHALTKDYAPANPAWRRPEWIEETLGDTLRLLSPADATAARRYRELVARVAALPRDRDGYGLVHYDAHSANLHVDGDTITLFDFDDCTYHWFAADVAMVIFYLITNQDDPAALLNDFLPPFLRGYRAENRLDPHWLATIHDHLTLREIDLYAVVQRSFGVSGDDAEALPHEWPRRFMRGRKARIETGQPYVDFDFSAFADYL